MGLFKVLRKACTDISGACKAVGAVGSNVVEAGNNIVEAVKPLVYGARIVLAVAKGAVEN